MYPIPFAIGRYTDPGPRSINEDAHFAVTFPSEHPSEVIAVLGVADGMGGLKKGQEASFSVLDTFQRKITERVYNLPPLISKGERLELLKAGIEEDFREANEEILRFMGEGKSVRAPLGSTMTVAVVMRSTVLVGHVGDSRATLVSSSGRFEQLTEDHAVGKKLVNRLGMEGMHVQIASRRIDDGQALVLCTDGVLDVLTPEEMARVVLTMPSVQEACNELVFRAKAKGTADNATVLALEYGRLRRQPAGRSKSAYAPAAAQAPRGAVVLKKKKRRVPMPAWRKRALGAAAFLLLVTALFGWLALKQYRSERAAPSVQEHESRAAGEVDAVNPASGPETVVVETPPQTVDTREPDPDLSSPAATPESPPGLHAETRPTSSAPAKPGQRSHEDGKDDDAAGGNLSFYLPNRNTHYAYGADLAETPSLRIRFFRSVPKDLKFELFMDGRKVQKDVPFSNVPGTKDEIELSLDVVKDRVRPGRTSLLEIGVAGTGWEKQQLSVRDSRLPIPKAPPKPRLEDLIARLEDSLGVNSNSELGPKHRVSIRYDHDALSALPENYRRKPPSFAVVIRREPDEAARTIKTMRLGSRGAGMSEAFEFTDTKLPPGEYYLQAVAEFSAGEGPFRGKFLQQVIYTGGFIETFQPGEDEVLKGTRVDFRWAPYRGFPVEIYVLSIAKSISLLNREENGPGHIHFQPSSEGEARFNLKDIKGFKAETQNDPSGVWYWEIKCKIQHRSKTYWVSSPLRSFRLGD